MPEMGCWNHVGLRKSAPYYSKHFCFCRIKTASRHVRISLPAKIRSMSALRISAISFLNTAPLMWDFENGESAQRLREHFDISYTIPSHCAQQLSDGSADIGIIPVAAYTAIPDLVIVPDVAIAAKNKVRSILLVSKAPLEKIRSVATDDSSRTSAALVEIYLRKFVGT